MGTAGKRDLTSTEREVLRSSALNPLRATRCLYNLTKFFCDVTSLLQNARIRRLSVCMTAIAKGVDEVCFWLSTIRAPKPTDLAAFMPSTFDEAHRARKGAEFPWGCG
eukprot:752537-Hanusia_phi.AAC.1